MRSATPSGDQHACVAALPDSFKTHISGFHSPDASSNRHTAQMSVRGGAHAGLLSAVTCCSAVLRGGDDQVGHWRPVHARDCLEVLFVVHFLHDQSSQSHATDAVATRNKRVPLVRRPWRWCRRCGAPGCSVTAPTWTAGGTSAVNTDMHCQLVSPCRGSTNGLICRHSLRRNPCLPTTQHSAL